MNKKEGFDLGAVINLITTLIFLFFVLYALSKGLVGRTNCQITQDDACKLCSGEIGWSDVGKEAKQTALIQQIEINWSEIEFENEKE